MIRTIVVDDDYRVAEVHAAFVGRLEGFEVVGTAHDAAQALAMTASLRPDLVLLDIYLPDRSGLDVLRELRAPDRPPVDVITITAARDVETLRAALQGGVVHYLVKPFTFDAFREKLEAYAAMRARLAGGGPLDQDRVDEIVRTVRARSSTLPKGLSRETLELVARALRDAAAELSATDVADRTGLSRVTARRYLEHLSDAGLVTITMRYGSSGRPEHLFRWAADARVS